MVHSAAGGPTGLGRASPPPRRHFPRAAPAVRLPAWRLSVKPDGATRSREVGGGAEHAEWDAGDTVADVSRAGRSRRPADLAGSPGSGLGGALSGRVGEGPGAGPRGGGRGGPGLRLRLAARRRHYAGRHFLPEPGCGLRAAGWAGGAERTRAASGFCRDGTRPAFCRWAEMIRCLGSSDLACLGLQSGWPYWSSREGLGEAGKGNCLLSPSSEVWGALSGSGRTTHVAPAAAKGLLGRIALGTWI